MYLEKNRILNNTDGFTLAEVLITLVIIGVIAALTVPTLMKNTQNQEFVSGLNKANSTLQQALYKVAIQNDYSIGDVDFTRNDDFPDLLAKELNAVKICTGNTGGCFPSGYKSLNNTVWNSFLLTKTIITADGVIYGWAGASMCGSKGLSAEDSANCTGRFIVDLNGHKGPNKFGRDVYFFLVVDGKGIVPAGAGNNAADCNINSYGQTCATRVLKENAMNY